MKVAIVTFNGVNNYGTALQELALNHAVNSCGNQAITISYRSTYDKSRYNVRNVKKYGIKKYLISIVGWIVDRFRIKKFKKFRENFLHTQWMNKDELAKNSGEWEFYLAGSDQIWNYEATEYDTTYFLDFVPQNIPKASYAASIGLNDISEHVAEEIGTLLKKFKTITVREKTAQMLIQKKLGVSSQVVLDPTLLLSAEEWGRVAKEVKIKGKYILIYQVGFSKTLIEFAKALSKKTRYRLVFVPVPMGSIARGKWLFNTGPAEWLWLIQNAEYVITDSYHATLFSINFNKNFWVQTCKEKICMGEKTSSRIVDILEKFGLSSRLLEDKTNNICNLAIDYTDVNTILSNERLLSYNILKEILQ